MYVWRNAVDQGSSTARGHRTIAEMRVKNTSSSSRSHLALNLQMARTIFGWSQEQLGLRSGLKRTYIGALERQEINPGIDNLDRIAAALGVPANVLILNPEEAQMLILRVRASRSAPAPSAKF
jgi:ribosome-binding protein aMBF1 (putative translation factor)